MALLYNISIEIAELIYVFAITIAMDVLVERRRIPKSTARKVIHLWMGGLIAFWFLFSTQYAAAALHHTGSDIHRDNVIRVV